MSHWKVLFTCQDGLGVCIVEAPSHKEASRKAIDFLQREHAIGFFLTVEPLKIPGMVFLLRETFKQPITPSEREPHEP